MRIGIDIDGVLAAFVPAYVEKLTKVSGIQFPVGDPNFPSTWYFEREAGVTRPQENEVWDQIRQSAFWATLLPMPGALDVIRELDQLSLLGRADVYFITSRPGQSAKRLTEFWLTKLGMENPTVILADEKGPVARGLKLDVFIDDRPENIADVFEWTRRPQTPRAGDYAGPQTRVYMIDAPYNRSMDMSAHRFTRVANVMEVLEREGLVRKVA
jgi:hypothetical protein